MGFQSTPPRSFSTSARVHPAYLPHIGRSGAAGKWLRPVVAAAAVGYGAATIYRSRHDPAAVAAAEAAELERQRKMTMLMDSYGDRSNLEELQNAVQQYEAQR